MKQITFMSDFVQIKGPRQSDKSYTIVFTTGEYVAKDIAKLLELSAEDKNYKVIVEVE